jgi:hypothetical protein
MIVLVHGVVLGVQIGLIVYATRLTSGPAEVAAFIGYALIVALELIALRVAMTPLPAERIGPSRPVRGEPLS